MIKIYFLRHGRQDSLLCNVDVSLSREGRMQAKLAGKRLKSFGIQALYTSDMLRAIETGDEINKFTNVPQKVYRNLREIEFGDLEGYTDEELHTKYAEFYAERDKFEEDIPFPGGENGQECFERMMSAIMDIIGECKANNHSVIAIVSHGGALRCFMAGILGMDMARRLQFVKTMENCSITEIDYDEKRNRFYIERVNDYNHLEEHKELLRENFKKTFL